MAEKASVDDTNAGKTVLGDLLSSDKSPKRMPTKSPTMGPDNSWKSSKSNPKEMLTKSSNGMMPISNSKVEKAEDSSSAKYHQVQQVQMHGRRFKCQGHEGHDQ